jgi:hypothetical protein
MPYDEWMGQIRVWLDRVEGERRSGGISSAAILRTLKSMNYTEEKVLQYLMSHTSGGMNTDHLASVALLRDLDRERGAYIEMYVREA